MILALKFLAIYALCAALSLCFLHHRFAKHDRWVERSRPPR